MNNFIIIVVVVVVVVVVAVVAVTFSTDTSHKPGNFLIFKHSFLSFKLERGNLYLTKNKCFPVLF